MKKVCNTSTHNSPERWDAIGKCIALCETQSAELKEIQDEKADPTQEENNVGSSGSEAPALKTSAKSSKFLRRN
jgi:hypothetical protein